MMNVAQPSFTKRQQLAHLKEEGTCSRQKPAWRHLHVDESGLRSGAPWEPSVQKSNF